MERRFSCGHGVVSFRPGREQKRGFPVHNRRETVRHTVGKHGGRDVLPMGKSGGGDGEVGDGGDGAEGQEGGAESGGGR